MVFQHSGRPCVNVTSNGFKNKVNNARMLSLFNLLSIWLKLFNFEFKLPECQIQW